MTEGENVYLQSNIYIENRESIRVTGVKDVDNFSEESISIQTQKGTLIIGGETLKISKLDVESGEMAVEGKLISLFYNEKNTPESNSFFSKIFK